MPLSAKTNVIKLLFKDAEQRDWGFAQGKDNRVYGQIHYKDSEELPAFIEPMIAADHDFKSQPRIRLLNSSLPVTEVGVKSLYMLFRVALFHLNQKTEEEVVQVTPTTVEEYMRDAAERYAARTEQQYEDMVIHGSGVVQNAN